MSGGDFGPVAPAAGEGPPFAVAGPSAVTLDAARSASVSFTVSNVSGRPVRARVLVLPGAGADASWFSVVGESERALPVAGTTIVDVAVKVSEKAPAGAASFVLGAALEEAPDRVVSSPTVSVQVPPPKPKPFPWWIVIVAVVALLLLVGGGILIWSLTRPDPKPSPSPSPSATQTPTPTEHPVLDTGSFLFEDNGMTVDLDIDSPDGIIDITLIDPDLQVIPFNRPTTLIAQRGLAIVPNPDFETCREASLASQVDIAEGARRTLVCVLTSANRLALLAFGPQIDGSSRRQVSITLWE
jgi:hypothetical protein